jgi:hypothetical protein
MASDRRGSESPIGSLSNVESEPLQVSCFVSRPRLLRTSMIEAKSWILAAFVRIADAGVSKERSEYGPAFFVSKLDRPLSRSLVVPENEPVVRKRPLVEDEIIERLSVCEGNLLPTPALA